MALNFSVAFFHPKHSSFSSFSSSSSTLFFIPKFKALCPPSYCTSPSRTFAQSEKKEGGVTEEDPPDSLTAAGSLSSARTQLDLLEQLTSTTSVIDGYESDGSSQRLTIRQQLAQLVGERDDDFSIPLGKNLKKVSAKFLTVSQKRNIRRQSYMDEVSQRNDSVFFATIGAFVILPPFVILGIAIVTGYVQLFP